MLTELPLKSAIEVALGHGGIITNIQHSLMWMQLLLSALKLMVFISVSYWGLAGHSGFEVDPCEAPQ